MNPILELEKQGQAIWLDYIRRSLITGGELKRLVEEDGIRGVTSNPTIFEKAIAGSDDYDEELEQLLAEDPHTEARDLYERLAFRDIQMAADVLRPFYDETRGGDGFVSLELSPDLAHDTQGSIAEARRFWEEVDRPNLMIKVPATPEGIPVIETLIAEGINVNVTLMFNLDHYEAVASAYIRGLEKCRDPRRVSSVASFFLSRIDTAVDRELEEICTEEALALRGKAAIASAMLAYKRFKEIFSGDRWKALSEKGARVQRPLWASTGTKNPAYSDVLYVESIIGTDTVNTLPPATLNAFRDHGQVYPTLEERWDEAAENLEGLASLGIDLKAITEKLQVEGAKAFTDSYDSLLKTLADKRQSILSGRADRQVMNLGRFQRPVDQRLKAWEEVNFSRRLWEKDYTLWADKPEEITNRLGWLFLPENVHDELEDLTSFAAEVKKDGIRHVVLLGMGGSSLAPEVYQKTFGSAPGYPELMVLDSTHPDAVRAVEDRIDPERTIFLVASKSGTTLETLSFFRYFWQKIRQITDNPGRHFAAITDPGTALEEMAKERGFRKVFNATPDLGGRYSALTVFGLVPAALIGMDVHKLLDRAWVASEGCAFCVAEVRSPALVLGAALGELAKAGRDKVTFLASPSVRAFPVWLEQLIAESTGKDGRGILPVVEEPAGKPESYGRDRVFVYFCVEGDDNTDLDARFQALEAVDHPTIKVNLRDIYDMGQEIFRWEVAVAAAGAVLGIHPFNQPDVEVAKKLARELMAGGGTRTGGDVRTVDATDIGALERAIDALFAQAASGDYVSVHAYLAPTAETTDVLQKMRLGLLRRLRLATTVGYGPRFLHSIGQLYKGGPDTGLFIQLVDEPREDMEVPEAGYTFGSLIKAQGLGDYLALRQKGRRVLRVSLGGDVEGGLNRILELIEKEG
jgi:transaldolase/glucose-6-phosphate isomerase